MMLYLKFRDLGQVVLDKKTYFLLVAMATGVLHGNELFEQNPS